MYAGYGLVKIPENDPQLAKLHSKAITASTTLAIIPHNKNYVINQDFSNDSVESWTIEKNQVLANYQENQLSPKQFLDILTTI